MSVWIDYFLYDPWPALRGRHAMQMYLISDNIDTYTGMRLAGVEGSVVHNKQELRETM